ncbi:MAG: putative sulfate exporter family transporter, partial [Trueperaceae bacterium]
AATAWLEPGAAWAAGPLLKFGVVLLGARLDARVLIELGPWVLVVVAAGAGVAYLVADGAGRLLGLPRDLRRLIGVGTAICGASAIAAAAPIVRADASRVSLAVATISLVGSAGVAAFAVAQAVIAPDPGLLGAWAGATLQEVGQVVAAGSLGGAAPA